MTLLIIYIIFIFQMEPGMADPGFPTSPTAANTATASMPGLPGIRFDPIYFRSIPGILKCVQMVSTCFLLFHACIINYGKCDLLRDFSIRA